MRWLLVWALGLAVGRIVAAEETLAVDVRSTVAESSPSSPNQGRVYALLGVQEIKGESPLVKPVDEKRLAHRLLAELDKNGFRAVSGGQRPEILITLEYGRGWLKFPYPADMGAAPAADLGPTFLSVSSGPTDVRSVTGVSTHLLNELTPGYLAKLQKASYEKLYVSVSAWAYPADAKARPSRIWTTTMILDDPDHRDLNTFASQMLLAGSRYFARMTEQTEVTVTVTAAAPHVRVGTPTMVEENAPRTPSPLAPAAPAARVVSETRKRFDLPAGDALEALQAFSQQSGEQIIYPSAELRSVRCPAVKGQYSPREALELLLVHSGLEAERDEPSGIFIIRRIAAR